jgi:hypothetical protein
MQYLMIHDIRKEYFDLSLNRYRLTFDDGLFSQYYYFPLYRNHPEKIDFFITTSFIKPGPARAMFSGEYLAYFKTTQYMFRSFIEDKFDHFMATEELQDLSRRPNVNIGVHSHFHAVLLTRTHPRKSKPVSEWKLKYFDKLPEVLRRDFSIRSKLAFQGYNYQDGVITRRTVAEWEEYIRYDTECSIRWVQHNLGLTPDRYCFPFNEYNQKLITILKGFGFKKFFAARPGKSSEVTGRIDIDSLLDD